MEKPPDTFAAMLDWRERMSREARASEDPFKMGVLYSEVAERAEERRDLGAATVAWIAALEYFRAAEDYESMSAVEVMMQTLYERIIVSDS